MGEVRYPSKTSLVKEEEEWFLSDSLKHGAL